MWKWNHAVRCLSAHTAFYAMRLCRLASNLMFVIPLSWPLWPKIITQFLGSNKQKLRTVKAVATKQPQQHIWPATSPLLHKLGCFCVHVHGDIKWEDCCQSVHSWWLAALWRDALMCCMLPHFVFWPVNMQWPHGSGSFQWSLVHYWALVANSVRRDQVNWWEKCKMLSFRRTRNSRYTNI